MVTVQLHVERIYFFWKQWLRGGETHVFLPFAKEEFIETSVRRAGGNWVSRFERVLDHATSVHYVTNEDIMGMTLFSPFVIKDAWLCSNARSGT